MKAHRIGAVVLRQAYEARHNLDRVTDALYWPVIDVLLWGFMSLYISRHATAGPRIASYLLGMAILWALFRSFQRDIAVAFLSDVWSRNLIGLFSTPLSIQEYVAGLVLINLLKAFAGMLVAGLVAWACYSFDIFPALPALLPHLGILVLFAVAVGIFITGLIFRFSTRIQSLTWSITGLIMPFSCVFYPAAVLPAAIRPLAFALPTTYAFEGMRAVLAGAPVRYSYIILGYVLSVCYLMGAAVAFARLFTAARASGLLVKIE